MKTPSYAYAAALIAAAALTLTGCTHPTTSTAVMPAELDPTTCRADQFTPAAGQPQLLLDCGQWTWTPTAGPWQHREGAQGADGAPREE